MSLRGLLCCALALCIGTAEAADTVPAPTPGRVVRSRSGIGVEAGALVIKNQATYHLVGPKVHVGLQIADAFGIYNVGAIDFLFHGVRGAQISDAILLDFTLGNRISIGVGPEVAIFAGVDDLFDLQEAAGGVLAGGRGHAAIYPLVGRKPGHARRRGLEIAGDLRVLTGLTLAGGDDGDGRRFRQQSGGLVLSPMFSIGYTAF